MLEAHSHHVSKVEMAEHKGDGGYATVDGMEAGGAPDPKLLTDEKGFPRSDLEKYDDDGHVAREGTYYCQSHPDCSVTVCWQ